MAEVEADARRMSTLEIDDRAARTSDAGVDSAFGITSSATRTPSGSASRQISSALRDGGAPVVVAGVVLRRRACRGARRDARTGFAARSAAPPRLPGRRPDGAPLSAIAVEYVGCPRHRLRRTASVIGACTLCKRQAGVAPATAPSDPPPARRGSRNGYASRTARPPRTRTQRSARGGRGRASGRGRGAWKSRNACDLRRLQRTANLGLYHQDRHSAGLRKPHEPCTSSTRSTKHVSPWHIARRTYTLPQRNSST